MLADFEAWLRELPGQTEDWVEDSDEPVDLATLLGQMTALRTEVNLQTRAVRSQQEQTSQILQQLASSFEQLKQTPPSKGEANPDERVRGLLKTLVDLYDALALAGREIHKARDRVVAILPRLELSEAEPTAEEIPAAPPRPPWLARLFGARPFDPGPLIERIHRLEAERRQRWADQQRRSMEIRETSERIAGVLSSLAEGYTMSLERVDRALKQHGFEPLEVVGKMYDPDQMEAVDKVINTGQPSGHVVEQVRRGYRWNGRVFRYAQVIVAMG